MAKPKRGKAKHALLTLDESDFEGFNRPKAAFRALQVGSAAGSGPDSSGQKFFLDNMPGAIGKKLNAMVPEGFELTQVVISGDISVKPLDIGVSGTVTATFAKKKPGN